MDFFLIRYGLNKTPTHTFTPMPGDEITEQRLIQHGWLITPSAKAVRLA